MAFNQANGRSGEAKGTAEALLQEILDREAIKELRHRYWRFLDAKDWDGFRQVFVDDVHVEIVSMDPIESGDEFVAYVRASAGARTVHHGHNPEITIDSRTEAHGTWALADYVEWEPDSETGERRGFKGYGRYDETYRKVDGEWKIASLRLSYIRMDPLMPEPLPATIRGPDHLDDSLDGTGAR